MRFIYLNVGHLGCLVTREGPWSTVNRCPEHNSVHPKIGIYNKAEVYSLKVPSVSAGCERSSLSSSATDYCVADVCLY